MGTRSVVVVSDAAMLWLLHPQAAGTVRELATPRDWLASTSSDRVAASLAATGLWCLAAWVGLGLLAVVLARLPGAAGTCAARVAEVALPAVLRRVVVGSAGLGIVLSPLSAASAAAAQAPDGPGGRPVAAALHVGASGTPLPGPGWPGSGEATTPGPAWPTPSPPTSSPTSSPTSPSPPPEARPATPAPVTPTPATPATSRTTVVRADDSLWLLGARRLGPRAGDADVAAYVSDLYRTNRDVIGDDPDLIRPGQQLTLPAPDSARDSGANPP